jgi:thymidylate synthase (FAD)
MEVTLIDKMGDDSRVVDAARVSFSKVAENYTQEQNNKLIKYLATHGHFTPFTHPMITVREKVPIFVARQRFKHTVGFTYNEVSRRYVDDTPEFYIPDTWRSRPDKSMKQGSGSEIIDHFPDHGFCCNAYDKITDRYEDFLSHAEQLYSDLLHAGVAPEQARMVLPQSMYTEYYCTGSLAAWARAYKLRVDAHAQKEIQDVAIKWDEIIRPLFPVAWSALVDE